MKPTSINANRESSLLSIQWDDGHTSTYTFSLLRAGCPCAQCRGGHANMSDRPDPGVFLKQMGDSAATHLKAIVPIGSYAITPAWEDGHDYGIYHWTYLRALCPCEECGRRYRSV